MSSQARISGRLLWSPEPQNLPETYLYDFAEHLKKHHDFDWGADYDTLWQWSGIIRLNSGQNYGTGMVLSVIKPALKLPTEIRCQGLSFSLRHVLIMLKNMLADADDTPAFIGYGEDGRCTRLTRKSLKRTGAESRWLDESTWHLKKGTG